jgi:biotin carboxyl carrier protein
MRYTFAIDSEQIELELAETSQTRFTVRAGSRELELVVLGTHPTLAVAVDGRVIELVPLSASSAGARGTAQVIASFEARARARASSAESATSALELKAPMPGRIVKVLVTPGQVVEAKTPALVMEAMKMENELVLSRGGTVRSVHVSAGATVERGTLLIVVDGG